MNLDDEQRVRVIARWMNIPGSGTRPVEILKAIMAQRGPPTRLKPRPLAAEAMPAPDVAQARNIRPRVYSQTNRPPLSSRKDRAWKLAKHEQAPGATTMYAFELHKVPSPSGVESTPDLTSAVCAHGATTVGDAITTLSDMPDAPLRLGRAGASRDLVAVDLDGEKLLLSTQMDFGGENPKKRTLAAAAAEARINASASSLSGSGADGP
jgi:hypothetical protein